jgi:hypothetical protein
MPQVSSGNLTSDQMKQQIEQTDVGEESVVDTGNRQRP